jgi:hypothetical protein
MASPSIPHVFPFEIPTFLRDKTMQKVPNGAVIFSGPSRIDGAPIVVIVTGLSKKSANSKTDDMVQSWIIRSDMSPLDALRTGHDASICGGCPHRPQSLGFKKVKGKMVATWFRRSCYVNVSQAPTSVYNAFKRGSYPTMTMDQLAAAMAGRVVRLGSYGDPAATPLALWQAYTALAEGWTGYTHQWKSARLRDVTSLCQASVDSVEEADKARSLGLGTFRVAPIGSERSEYEQGCPASKEFGAVTSCAKCRKCDGSSAARNIVIDAHGIGSKYVAPRKSLPVLA